MPLFPFMSSIVRFGGAGVSILGMMRTGFPASFCRRISNAFIKRVFSGGVGGVSGAFGGVSGKSLIVDDEFRADGLVSVL
jgi:hypothetical protein